MRLFEYSVTYLRSLSISGSRDPILFSSFCTSLFSWIVCLYTLLEALLQLSWERKDVSFIFPCLVTSPDIFRQELTVRLLTTYWRDQGEREIKDTKVLDCKGRWSDFFPLHRDYCKGFTSCDWKGSFSSGL